VPGKVDRAFYKALLIKIFRDKEDTTLEDLDASERRTDKDNILSAIFNAMPGSPIKKSAVLKLEKKKSNKEVYIIILPAEQKVTDLAKNVLFYQINSDEPTIDLIVIVEDWENLGPIERITALKNAIASLDNIRFKDSKSEKGEYFEYYRLDLPNSIGILLIAQGLSNSVPGLNIPCKHAIEDLIMSLFSDDMKRISKEHPKLLEKICKNKVVHKKLVSLLMIDKCCVDINILLFKHSQKCMYEDLIKKHDGIKRLIDILEKL